jgi:hypothetical protein
MIRPARTARIARPALLVCCFLLGLAACGDNYPGHPDAGKPPAATGPRAVVVSGTFVPGEAGVMSALGFDPLEVEPRVAPNGAVGDDPVLRLFGGELFVVNRADGNNVTILDAATFRVKAQIATGIGSNPQDVAVAGDKLFVPAFGTAGVVVLDRAAGTRATIDLSALDPDGQPNCISAYAVGGDVYVACELLDAIFTPRGPGRIAVIDAATNAVKTTFVLANANPFGVFEQLPDGVLGGDLVIPTVPSFFDFSIGCVERVQTGAAPKANGCVVTNAAVSGYVARIAFQRTAGAVMQWMVVSKFDTAPRGNLQGYDLSTSTLWSAPISPPTQILVDAAVCPNDAIVVADQTMAANGLRVYASSAEQTTAPMPVGLKPNSSRGLVCYE